MGFGLVLVIYIYLFYRLRVIGLEKNEPDLKESDYHHYNSIFHPLTLIII